ncbi:hypothetical protein NFHSH190041_34650 [Shewanella sp. NFH-SH190041]|uniref:nitrous oxide-stimulated promoter family protein n=1 Tax=Shewanella sp. NFH-SH190041 TaxID=2950245 RepID=UPI0021C307BD|nr:nitrous oxide-stimulated promoter family protein [Shewanella sp. NFH-SH190041]BDM66013.1 hypothetical protein NFHSH190041_34650 [Shewanella sp. NFH-SH190041]
MADKIPLSGGLEQEYQTIAAMVNLYCRKHHGKNSPCDECQQFLHYVRMRLDRCPYGTAKPTCNRCPVHCYKPAEKAQAKTIMRFAGPRMLLHHPLLAIKHLWHERRPAPGLPPKAQSNRHLRQAKPQSDSDQHQ